MIEPGHLKLSLSRQCYLLRVSRSSLYHKAKGESAENLALMRRIDEVFLRYPFYGSRHMVRHLWRKGVRVANRMARIVWALIKDIYRVPAAAPAAVEDVGRTENE